LNALLKTLGYADALVTTIKPTGAEKIGAVINAISPLLLTLACWDFIRIQDAGDDVGQALLAVIAFLLYFLGGLRGWPVGMEWIIVFVIGLALVISEFFVHPGTVLPGIIGMILILVSLVMAMGGHVSGTPAIPTMPQIKVPVEKLVTSFGIAMVLMIALARVLPRRRCSRRWSHKPRAASYRWLKRKSNSRPRRTGGGGHLQSSTGAARRSLETISWMSSRRRNDPQRPARPHPQP